MDQPTKNDMDAWDKVSKIIHSTQEEAKRFLKQIASICDEYCITGYSIQSAINVITHMESLKLTKYDEIPLNQLIRLMIGKEKELKQLNNVIRKRVEQTEKKGK